MRRVVDMKLDSGLTLAFSVKHEGDGENSWPTVEEALAALLRRVADLLLADPQEVAEAILGDRFDVYIDD